MILKPILIALSMILYRLGGADGYSKLYRRLGVPACVAVVCVIGQNWIGLLTPALMYGVLSMGYGINSHLTKWLKNPFIVRGAVGLLLAVSSLPLLWGQWNAIAFYSALSISFWVLNGNQKFLKNDVQEEMGMGLCAGFLIWLA